MKTNRKTKVLRKIFGKMSSSSSNRETYLRTPSSMLQSPLSSPSYQGTSDLIVRVELRRNDNGKTVGMYAERLVDREPLSLDQIKDYWDQYQEKLPHIFQSSFELPFYKLSYFVYWTRYNVRDEIGFYFKCMAWHERRTIPDPYMDQKRRAYVLHFVFFMVEDEADTIPHEDHEIQELVE